MNTSRKTQRDRLSAASTTLSSLVEAIQAGESIGRERLEDIKETLRVVRNEPENEPEQLHQRLYVIPVMTFDRTLDTLRTPEVLVQLLRDALGEFTFSRTPIDEYVRRRYGWMTVEQKAEKEREVYYRTQLARDLVIEHLEIAMFDPRIPR